MHICIVGTGAAGWIACNYLKNLDIVDKITIIGSSKIPSIGVGESTTMDIIHFLDFLIDNGEFSLEDFIYHTDAAVKYGVMYQGWSSRDFLHYFKHYSEFSDFGDKYSYEFYGRLLANKDANVHIHDLMGKEIFEESKKNNLLVGNDLYLNTYHFSADMFIDFMSKNALKNNKVSFIDAEVLGGNIIDDDIKNIRLNNKNIKADFYIFATGDKKINEDFLSISYEDFYHCLITDKAVFYPLNYTNKRKEFHPYTVAKTMKNGWRWITPTWSRIGTGYVFSSNHVSVDEAINEFINDIGDTSIEPRVVNFNPKKNKQEIHKNWCTLGMASGFLEPLDAPGLALSISSLMNEITSYLYYFNNTRLYQNKNINQIEIEKYNDSIYNKFLFWASFIFSQYKTSTRNDTKFWRDYKTKKWNFYDDLIKNIDEYNPNIEKMMIQSTMASKDITWKSYLKTKPFKTKSFYYKTQNHLDFITNIRNNVIIDVT